jgi:hypothetical protein
MTTVLKIMAFALPVCIFHAANHLPPQTVHDASAVRTGAIAVPGVLPSPSARGRRKRIAPCS